MSASQNRRIDALNRILELAMLLSHDMKRSLAAQGLTPSRVTVVWEILHRGPVTQRELADAMHVTARNMTGLVDGLVDGGFVSRERHPTDRRATLVTLTAAGTEVAQRLERDQHDLADLLFSGMPQHELGVFVEGLDHVVTKLNEHGLDLAATHEEKA